MNIIILFAVDHKSDRAGYNLPRHRSHSRSGNTHSRHPAKTENKDRVQNDIDDSACPLGDHNIEGSARGLQESLKHKLRKKSEGTAAHYAQVFHPILYDLRILRLTQIKASCHKQSYQQKEQIAYRHQDNTAGCRIIRPLLLLLTQCLGEHRIDTDTGAACHGDHQCLDGKRK